MLREIKLAAEKVDSLRQQAESAHRRARLVLDNVSQGFVMVDADGTMNSENSQALEILLGEVSPGMKVWEYFAQNAPDVGNWLEMAWFQLEMGKLPPSLVLEQVPKHSQQMAVIDIFHWNVGWRAMAPIIRF